MRFKEGILAGKIRPAPEVLEYWQNALEQYRNHAPMERETAFYLYPWVRCGVSGVPSQDARARFRGLHAGSDPLRQISKQLLSAAFFNPVLRTFLPQLIVPDRESADSWDMIYVSRSWGQILLFDTGRHAVLHLAGDLRTRESLMQEIKVRREEAAGLGIPELISAASRGEYFEEAWIDGEPLYCAGDSVIVRGVRTAFERLWSSYQKNGLEVYRLEAYLRPLKDMLEMQASDAQADLRMDVLETIQALFERMSKEYAGRDILTATVHGDLHLGNMIRDRSGNLYILDWQARGRKSLYYDWLNQQVTCGWIYRKLRVSGELRGQNAVVQSETLIKFFRELLEMPGLYRDLFVLERTLFYLSIPGVNMDWLRTWLRWIGKESR